MRTRLAAALLLVSTAGACASLSGLSGGDAGEGTDAKSKDAGVDHSTGSGSARSSGSGSGSDADGGPMHHDATSHQDAAFDAGAPGCNIGGKAIASGTAEPGSSCMSCNPTISTSTWSNDPDGMQCGTDGVCQLGACVSGCVVGGVYYMTGIHNPNDPCQLCQPPAVGAWSSVEAGTNCGNSQICSAGQCGTQCDVDGGVVLSGASNASDPCQLCEPGSSTVNWSYAAPGTLCAPGSVCAASACMPGCYVGNVYYTPGSYSDAGGACELCTPDASTTALTPATEGVPSNCPTEQLCHLGACTSGCEIDGGFFGPQVADPANPCLICHPVASTTTWYDQTNGTSCAANKVCENGACTLPTMGSGSGTDKGSGSGTSEP